MAGKVNIFEFDATDFMNIDQVGQATAEILVKSVGSFRDIKKDVPIVILEGLCSKARWSTLIDQGLLSLEYLGPKDEPNVDVVSRLDAVDDNIRKMHVNLAETQMEFKEQMRQMYREVHDRFQSLESRLPPMFMPPPGFQSFNRAPPPVQPVHMHATDDKIDHIKDEIDKKSKDGIYVGSRSPSIEGKPSEQGRQGRATKQDRFLYRAGSKSPEARRRSVSPQTPKMVTFNGGQSGVRFETFRKRFEQIADRRDWDFDKRLNKLLDCLVDQALDFALSSSVSDDYVLLMEQLSVRYGHREDPLVARQRLSVAKQEGETVEDFLQTIQTLADDGYPDQKDNILLTQIITEAFLRGVNHKEAALYAIGRNPQNAHQALNDVKSYIANAKVLGVGKQVTFQQKAVTVSLDQKLEEALDKLLKGMERIEGKLERGSRSVSPFNRASSPSREDWRNRSPNRQNESDRGRDRTRYDDSRRDRGRFRSPSPYRNDYSQNSQYRERTGSRSPDRGGGYRGFSPNKDSYARNYPRNGNGQSRQQYVRTINPASATLEEGELNSQGLPASATNM